MAGFSSFEVMIGCFVIVMPLGLALPLRWLLLRVVDDQRSLDQVNQLTIAVVVWTLGGLMTYLVGVVCFAPSPSAIRLAPWMGFIGCMLFLFFVAPSVLVARKYPLFRSPDDKATNAQKVPTRSASLTRRDEDWPIKRSAWVLLWGVWLIGVGALVWSLTHPRGGADPGNPMLPVMFPLFAAIVLMVGPRSIRGLANEAEPLDAGRSPELTDGYRALRHFRACARFYLMPVGFVVTATTLTCGLAWGVPEFMILGTCMFAFITLGIASAVCAMIANVRRAQLTELLDQLSKVHPKQNA